MLYRECFDCDDDGNDLETGKECPICEGSGIVPDPQATRNAALGELVQRMPDGFTLTHTVGQWYIRDIRRHETLLWWADTPQEALAALEEESDDTN